MALLLRLCGLFLALSSRLVWTVQADCSKDCASCSYRLGHHAEINPLVSGIHVFPSNSLTPLAAQEVQQLLPEEPAPLKQS